ncbi:MAG: UvrD-helicase domain-containing protein [Bacteroidota bacterium]|nr:UvrD-helicase domain-containing protein [Bacteroidota bacterium]
MAASKTDLSQLNDKQKQAVINDDKRLLVLAGAGSGKTKTLLQKILYLIEEKHVNPSNILAVTFSKNAANEMLDRLIIAADKTNEYFEFINDKNKSPKQIYDRRFFYRRKQFSLLDLLKDMADFRMCGWKIVYIR